MKDWGVGTELDVVYQIEMTHKCKRKFEDDETSYSHCVSGATCPENCKSLSCLLRFFVDTNRIVVEEGASSQLTCNCLIRSILHGVQIPSTPSFSHRKLCL